MCTTVVLLALLHVAVGATPPPMCVPGSYCSRMMLSPEYEDLRCAYALGIIKDHPNVPERREQVNASVVRRDAARLLDQAKGAGFVGRDAFAASDATAKHYLPRTSIEPFWLRIFRDHLASMREPELSDTGDEAFRVLVIRSYGAPLAVRLVGGPGGASVVAKLMTGDTAGSRQGALCRRIEQRVTDDDFHAVRTCLKEVLSLSTPNREGMDGSEVLVEGRYDSQYAIRHEWSPPKGPVRDCLLKVLGVAGFDAGYLRPQVSYP